MNAPIDPNGPAGLPSATNDTTAAARSKFAAMRLLLEPQCPAGIKAEWEARGRPEVSLRELITDFDSIGEMVSPEERARVLNSPDFFGERRERCLGLRLNPSEEGSWCYEIEYSRLDTAEKLVDWIRHLAEKSWIRPEHIRLLIAVGIEHGAKVVDA